RLRERRPGRGAQLPRQRHPDDRLRVSRLLRDFPQAGVGAVRPSQEGQETVPDPLRRLPDRLQERPLEPGLRLGLEEAACRARGPPQPPQRAARREETEAGVETGDRPGRAPGLIDMMPDPQGDMPPEEFREEGRRLVDWLTDYFQWSLDNPVLSRLRPGAIRAALPADAPEEGEAFERIPEDFDRALVPGLTQWNHPGYCAYFPCGFSTPGALADFLSTAVSQQAMLWRTSPAATELEEVVLAWLRRALGMPDPFEGVIYDTASTAVVHALVTARHEKAPEVRTRGLAGRERSAFRVYASEHAHSSVDKAVITLGLGHENLRRIAVDAEYRMRSDLLRQAIEEDRRAGHAPLAVVATVGTTSVTSVDPVGAIADLCAREGGW